jgi:hypothetical protein
MESPDVKIKSPRKVKVKEVKEVKAEVKEVKEVKAEVKEVKEKKKQVKKEEVKPKWEDLYFLLSQTGTSFLRSLVKRDDIPDDAKHLLHGVIGLADVCDCCIVDQQQLTIEKMMFWSDALKELAGKKVECA